MKRTLFILAIALACGCKAQDSSNYSGITIGYELFIIDHKYDTIQCIMLVTKCDDGCPLSTVSGFIIRKYTSEYYVFYDLKYYPYAIGYMDRNRKPLPKEWTVWITK